MRERQRSFQFSQAEEQAKLEIFELSTQLEAQKRKLATLGHEYEEKIEALHRQHMER